MSLVFHRAFEPEPIVPSLLRREFRRWLRALDWPEELAADLVLAVDEAVTNVIDHAYPDDPVNSEARPGSGQHSRRERIVEVRAKIAAAAGQRRVLIDVVDQGRWRPVPEQPGYRGRGLKMMRALTDSLTISPSSTGTRVSMVSRPVDQTAANPDNGNRANARELTERIPAPHGDRESRRGRQPRVSR